MLTSEARSREARSHTPQHPLFAASITENIKEQQTYIPAAGTWKSGAAATEMPDLASIPPEVSSKSSSTLLEEGANHDIKCFVLLLACQAM